MQDWAYGIPPDMPAVSERNA